MQLHIGVCILVCLHSCVNMFPIMSDGALASSFIVHTCYMKGCIHGCTAQVDTYVHGCYSSVHIVLACTCGTHVYVGCLLIRVLHLHMHYTSNL